jgi:hypothetical protein
MGRSVGNRAGAAAHTNEERMEAIRDVTDDEFRQLWATAKSIRDVQKACGLTYDATYQKARGLGLPRRVSKGKTKQIDVPLLFKLWGREVEVREIAHVLGVSEAYVGRLARKHHLPKRLPQKAENNGRTVADPTPEEIAERAAEIRARRPVAQDDGTVEIRCYAFDARHAVYSEGSLWVA